MLKRRKKEEDHVDESWLLPYADILTLLLALFIVLFASSEVDLMKFEAISDSFNTELQGGTGVLEQQAAIKTSEEISQLAELGDEDSLEDKSPEELARERDFKELGELQEKFEAYIEDKGLSLRLQTQLTGKGLLLTIKEGVLYESGNANLTEEAKTMTTEISELLITDVPRFIYIEGHTDNVPVQSDEFPSNWELSSARAINFMKLLLENENLDPQKFSATGYGEHQPISSNDTPQGKSTNRRVEVLISPYQEEI